jgi:hypothetical protein
VGLKIHYKAEMPILVFASYAQFGVDIKIKNNMGAHNGI